MEKVHFDLSTTLFIIIKKYVSDIKRLSNIIIILGASTTPSTPIENAGVASWIYAVAIAPIVLGLIFVALLVTWYQKRKKSKVNLVYDDTYLYHIIYRHMHRVIIFI